MDFARVIASSGGTYTYRVCLSTKNPIIHSVSPKGWVAGRFCYKISKPPVIVLSI